MKILNSVDPESLLIPSIKIPYSDKKNLETKIRCLFLSKGYRKFPKKEYIRCKLIRGHRRILREIQANENNIDALYENEGNHQGKLNFLSKMLEIFKANRDLFSKIIKIEAGPINVTLKKRKLDTDSMKKSFNAEFCRDYFESIASKESYSYYVEYLFSELSCLKLNKIFGFRCCSSPSHKSVCLNKWVLMKRYCRDLILEDIGLAPYETDDKVRSIPTFYLSERSSNEVCLFN